MPRTLLTAALLILLPSVAWGVEKVSIRRDGKVHKLAGKVLQEDQGGAVFLLAPDGVIWTISGAEVIERKSDETPFKPLSRDELAEQVLAAMPAGSDVHHTEHYLIAYNTSVAYAKWCGALYERFYAAFHKHWSGLGWKLSEPEMPLVALVFDDKDSYGEYARPEIGAGVESMAAYYNLGSNRVVMYDLTGFDAGGKKMKRATDAAGVEQHFFTVRGAAFNVATIVHEAAHQLTFNCGLHQRFADLPLWVLEGLAVYLETPDQSKAGKEWKTIGALNSTRLADFRASLKKRPRGGEGLVRLLSDNKRFQNPVTFKESYGESWAFNYFLFQKHQEKHVEFLRMLAKKEPGIVDEPEDRVQAFQAIFGDLKPLDEEFLKFMQNPKKAAN